MHDPCTKQLTELVGTEQPQQKLDLLRMWWLLEKPVEKKKKSKGYIRGSLAAKAVEGAALALQSVDNVHGCDGLALGVLGVGDSVADHVLEEDLENTAGLLVDEARDALHATTAGETADGGLGDALDVVAKDLPVTLGASLAEALASLATSRHI